MGGFCVSNQRHELEWRIGVANDNCLEISGNCSDKISEGKNYLNSCLYYRSASCIRHTQCYQAWQGGLSMQAQFEIHNKMLLCLYLDIICKEGFTTLRNICTTRLNIFLQELASLNNIMSMNNKLIICNNPTITSTTKYSHLPGRKTENLLAQNQTFIKKERYWLLLLIRLPKIFNDWLP